MTREESNKLCDEIDQKRIEIADRLFSPQRHTYRVSNARKLVALASELAELVAILERYV